MSNLAQQPCEACRAGAPRVTGEERAQLTQQVPAWRLITVDGIDQLQREFTFGNFVEALSFTHKVGELAEQANHHPAILTEWGRVTVTWWTHKIKGLHRNDFIMAARTDDLLTRSES